MSELHRDQQFGVSGKSVSRVWPTITPADKDALSNFYPFINGVTRITKHAPRPFSSACLFTTNEARYFVKRHDLRVKSLSAIAQEHHLITWLSNNGVPTHRPCFNRAGGSVTLIGQFVYEIFPAASGIDLYQNVHSWEGYLSSEHARSAGATLGKLHVTMQDYEAPPRWGVPLISSMALLREDDFAQALDQRVAATRKIAPRIGVKTAYAEARGLLLQLYATLEPHLHLLPRRWGHGDWHGSNLMWHDTTATAAVDSIFDFGMADETATLFDVAVAIERGMISWLEADAPDWRIRWPTLEAFLEGYITHNLLSRAECAAIAAVLPFVHLEFALSEVEYYAALLDDQESAKVALNKYFLCHTQWMIGTEGSALRHYLTSTLPDRLGLH